MIAEGLLMAMTVWYIPGWMRSHAAEDGVVASLAETFPGAEVAFKAWDGDNLFWPKAVENADAAVEGFVREIVALPPAERENLVIVGHSLGGRITARILARLDERSLKIGQAALLGAAMPYADRDVRWIGNGARLPVLLVCNPDDITLKYVYATVGGEKVAALGANGALQKLVNVEECVIPAEFVHGVKLPQKWAEVPAAREVANHYAIFYLACLRQIVRGEGLESRVMVPQGFVTVEWPVMDAGIWWDVVEEAAGWKLERNRLTGHARILDPRKVRKAWGAFDDLRKSFAKVKGQL